MIMNINNGLSKSKLRVNKAKSLLLVIIVPILLAACDQQQSSQASGGNNRSSDLVRPKVDFASAVNGGRLFQENCAQCHGQAAEGHPEWKKPLANGKHPAPPLNGSGHTWHHPKKGLIRTIKHGTAQMGGSMPAWKEKLNDKDIDDIIAWFQARWSDETYRAWQNRDRG